MVDENGLKVLSCGFFDDVLCSFRKDAKFSLMGRCLECSHYKRFMCQMDAADEKVDAEFLAESERVNRFARCLFVDCFCDSEVGKFACFGYKVVGDGMEVWKCRRFDVEKLKADSVMGEAYFRLVKGGLSA